MPIEFTLPDLGEGITEAQIVRVLISDGDRVAQDQYLMEVETDKAAVEIPSPYAGIAKTIHVKAGQTINVGDVIVTFDGGGEAAAATPAVADAPQPKPVPQVAVSTSHKPAKASPVSPSTETPSRKTTVPAAPSVRKLARELRIDLDQVPSSGPGGRVLREDVQRFASQGTVAVPEPTSGISDADKWGPIRREPLSQIRKTISNQMTRAAFTAVHVTHCDEADITELGRVRAQLNEMTDEKPKLTLMSFVIRAVCLALRKHPIFNSSLDEEQGEIIYKDYVNIGIAVDTERGLIVPVLRNADQLSLAGVASSLQMLAGQIRTNKFGVDDLRGGTFTITNVGALGGTVSTPIINYPEVAILGLGRARNVAVFREGTVVEASVLPVNLSFDHRVTDGANAARFASEMISYLETPAKFLLDQ